MTEVPSLTALDLIVLAVILLGLTALARSLARHQTDARDYFLGGGRLPWYAVAASLVATEISAVTYVSLPSVVARPGGNLAFLQIAVIGYVLARCLVTWLLIGPYYDQRSASPYEWVQQRLGGTTGQSVGRLLMALFSIGGVLAQSARIYLTSVVLQVLLFRELAWLERTTGLPPLWSSVLALAAVALLWTWWGGIAAVVWTDAVLFVLFLVGAAVSLVTVRADEAVRAAGGLSAGFERALAEGKLDFLRFEWSLSEPYTVWAALFGATLGGLAAFGTDQLLVQRLFCCEGVATAKKAMLASSLSAVVSVLFAGVGVVLWVFVENRGLSEWGAAQVELQADRLLPVFVLEVVPAGARALVVAGVIAAAISSFDSILSALAQTSSSWLSRGRSTTTGDAGLRQGRRLVVLWAGVLSVFAVAMDGVARRYDALLDLALAMAGYTGGAVLGCVLWALWLPTGRREEARGLLVSAPLSVLCVLGVAWPGAVPAMVLSGLSLLIASLWIRSGGRIGGALAMGVALPPGLAWGTAELLGSGVAWPWFVPLGCAVTLLGARALVPSAPSLGEELVR